VEPKFIREYHVFLASPGDMNAERKEVREFFERYNRHTASKWNIRFTVIDYENYSSIGVGRPQELITEQTLQKFSKSLALVIGIMGQRFGSPTGDYESGTEEEFSWAYQSYISTGFPEIKWFFKKIETFQAAGDPNEVEEALKQWKLVRAFQEKLKNGNPPLFYETFTDLIDFRGKLQDDLSLWLYDESRPWHQGQIRVEIPPFVDLPLAYYEALVEQFGSLDIGGIDNDRAVDIPLQDVYLRLRVMADEDTEGEVEKPADSTDGPIDIHTALGLYKDLVIVGDPGSGKSTFLKYIALMLARSHTEQNPALAMTKLNLPPPLPVPFFVSLWDLSDAIKHVEVASVRTIIDFISARVSDYSVNLDSSELQRLLESGACCLLFDGLDEVPTEAGRALVSRLVEKFVTAFGKNRFVVTSRGRGYTGHAILKSGFVRCDIQDLDETDRKEFLQNWFAALLGIERDKVLGDASQAKMEFEALSNSIETKDRIRMLAVNPLLMTVIAIVHWNRKRLPDQRVDLYDECVDVLLGQRKAAERISMLQPNKVMDEGVEDLNQYDRTWTRKRFSEIALSILEHGSDEINREKVVELLTPRFLDRGSANKDYAHHDATVFLDRQELRSGLLVSRRSQSFRFVHLTFQEYLAAWNLANQSMDSIVSVIGPSLRDPQWFEPLQLLGGELAKGSDEKLDDYVAYLLNQLGPTITHQAPVIALCANILKDIKGVANVKAETKLRFEKALRGTLAVFELNSGVSPKNQLEVLNALVPLGASVKEHLIAATKSTYYQVRSEALNVLARHLSDDDLFEKMSHIMEDRSQDTIRVYLYALFDRNLERAVSFLNSHDRFSTKACNAIGQVFRRYGDVMDSATLLSIAEQILKQKNYWVDAYQAIFPLKDGLGLKLKTLFAEFLEREKDYNAVENALDLLCDIYSLRDTWPMLIDLTKYAQHKLTRELAIRKMSEYVYDEEFWASEIVTTSDLMGRTLNLMETSIQDSSAIVRRLALKFLAATRLKDQHELLKLVTQHLDGYEPFWDPKESINVARVKYCSRQISRSPEDIWQSYEQLAKILPLKLVKG